MTYGIVFFGVPQHAEDGFDVLSSADAEAGPLPSEPPLMAALRRDLLWLKDSNLKFSRIRADFITTYFTEAPPPITAGQNQVCMPLSWGFPISPPLGTNDQAGIP